MSKSTNTRTRLPNDPERLNFSDWLPANRGLYENFRTWLKDSGYSPSALNLYGTAARHALGYLQKAYWQIDPEIDLPNVWAYLQRRSLTAASLEGYHKGLLKFGEYLRLRLKQPAPEKPLHWDYYLARLPAWLAETVRQYLAHCARRWSVERQTERAMDALSHLTLSLRQMQSHQSLASPADLTPAAWYAYLDQRLAAGIKPVTLNAELAALQEFVRFLENQGEAICERLLRVEALTAENRLPRDASPAQLRLVYQEIERDADSQHALLHRCGQMDRAWFLLMLHSGLRTGEVRRLKLAGVDFDRRQVRIEQSKGLKDRLVFLTTATIQALTDYLAVRGPSDALPTNIFIYRHKPLTEFYCLERLKTYGARCGVVLTPHQLRHSCATLLLNAGAPVTSVKTILGHKHIDTTLGYARLYDGTLAADYYRAMNEVERQLRLVEHQSQAAPSLGELIALIDSLRSGTLTESQSLAVQALREGLLALAEKEASRVVISQAMTVPSEA